MAGGGGSGGGGASGLKSPLTTKGDLWGFTTTDARIPVGADGTVLVADHTQAAGVRWAVGGGSTDANAWHKTGDSFGVDGILGTLDDHAVLLYANSQEFGRIVDNGPDLNWTGPRLLIGQTVANFPNADILDMTKNLGDQLFVNLTNPNSNVNTPAGSGFNCINDAGIICGLQLFNSNWISPPNPNSDGIFPNEGGVVSNGNVVLVSNTKIRFVVDEVDVGNVNLVSSVGQWTLTGNLIVHSGVLEVSDPGAFIQVGNAGTPNAGGAWIGISGEQSLHFDDDASSLTSLKLDGKPLHNTGLVCQSGGPSGGTTIAYLQIANADGASVALNIPESGVTENYFSKVGFSTLYTSTGIGLRANVNATDNSGWSIDSSGDMTIFGKIGFFGGAPAAQQTVTGSRASGAALTSLLTALAAYNEIVDHSTA